eukprot:6172875-Pleurochrysis_carterae.AAC.6
MRFRTSPITEIVERNARELDPSCMTRTCKRIPDVRCHDAMCSSHDDTAAPTIMNAIVTAVYSFYIDLFNKVVVSSRAGEQQALSHHTATYVNKRALLPHSVP